MAQYTKRLPPNDSPHRPHPPARPLFVTHTSDELSSRDSAHTSIGVAASEHGDVERQRASQPRDATAAIDALLRVAESTLGARIAVISHGSDALKSADPRVAAAFGHDIPLAQLLAAEVRQGGRPVLIEDTRSHALVRGVPIVRGMRVLSCMAEPIHDPANHFAAALCVFDGVPRWWSAEQEQLLARVACAMGPLLAGSAMPESRIDRDRATALDVASGVPFRATEALLQSVADGLLVLDRDWNIVWCNRGLGAILDVPEQSLPGTSARRVFEPLLDAVATAAVQRSFELSTPTTFTFHYRPGDRWFTGRAWPMADRLAVLLRDTTVERLAEEARQQQANQQRDLRTLDAVGQLAGGVAHVFNNLLTVIRANAELLQQTAIGADVPVELGEIHRASARATDITQHLLAFGQQQLLEPELVSLNDVIGAVEPTMRAMLPSAVRIETSLALDDTTVLADAPRLQLALLQLVRNARDAMADGGVLHITTDLRVLSSSRAATPVAVPPGRWVTLAVRDTGHGIAPEHLHRVFEPFFTTREVGSGVGLGLASVHGITAQSGGALTVESEPGRGATFIVWLPAVDQPPARRGAHEPRAQAPAR